MNVKWKAVKVFAGRTFSRKKGLNYYGEFIVTGWRSVLFFCSLLDSGLPLPNFCLAMPTRSPAVRAIRFRCVTFVRLCPLNHYPFAATSPTLVTRLNSGLLELPVIWSLGGAVCGRACITYQVIFGKSELDEDT